MPEKNSEIARRGYLAFKRSGVEGILEFLDPEIEWRTWKRFARQPRVVWGHAGVREVIAFYEENFDQLAFEPHEYIDGDDVVVAPVRLGGKVRGSGEEVGFELFHVWSVSDGKAIRFEVFDTKEEALAAAGLSAD